MKILDELKYQVEQRMRKTQVITLTNKDKVLFLTTVLYDKLSVKETCQQLRIPFELGQAVLSEHYSLLKTKKYKNQKRSNKTNCPTSSHSPPVESELTLPLPSRSAGVKLIAKDYDWRKFSIQVSLNGRTISDRTLATKFCTIIKIPTNNQN